MKDIFEKIKSQPKIIYILYEYKPPILPSPHF